MMTRERLLEHVEAFNTMCSELSKAEALSITIREKGKKESYVINLHSDVEIKEVTLTNTISLTLIEDEKQK